MAVRTATSQDLDTKINDLMTSLDSYLALAGQSGEPANAAADYFWRVLIHKLVQRSRMKPVLLGAVSAGPRMYVPIPKTDTATVEATDPNA